MSISDKKVDELIKLASKARPKAYAPYSNYKVGVALLAASGEIYTGVNVENAIYRGTHAEKLALDKAVMEGEREFKAVAVVTDDPKVAYPCGQCLQDLTEFDTNGTGKLEIIAANLDGVKRRATLDKLFPFRFSPRNLDIDVKDY